MSVKYCAGLLAVTLGIYVLNLSVFGFLSPVAYVLMVYIVVIGRVDETNFIWHAVLFGLVSDWVRGGFVGPGVIMYLVYGLLALKAGIFLDMEKFFSRFLFRFVLVAVHILVNLLMTSYISNSFISIYLYYLLINTLVLAFVVGFSEVSGAFKSIERRSA
jgi:rod shape-determining protein MreD